SYGAVVSRAWTGCRCDARSCANVVAANAFFVERFRLRVTEPRSGRSDTRANAARDGRGFGSADVGPAAGASIGGPSLERLLDTRSDFILGKAASGRPAHVDWALSACGVDCEQASAQGSQARIAGQAAMSGVAP